MEILCYSYVLVSANDVAGSEWCTVDGSLLHLNVVEQYARWGGKSAASLHSRLVEAESTIRHERNRLMQQDKSITLDDAIELTYCYDPSLVVFHRFSY